MNSDLERGVRYAVSMHEAAVACNLSRSTLYRLLAQGKITTVKIGSRRLVPLSSIHDLLRVGER
jgi:excisionase family DNA binding protein